MLCVYESVHSRSTQSECVQEQAHGKTIFTVMKGEEAEWARWRKLKMMNFIICTLHQISVGWPHQGGSGWGAGSTHGRSRKSYKIFIWEPKKKYLFGK
jgi:hypothetical protein